jgi:hypothetical protein
VVYHDEHRSFSKGIHGNRRENDRSVSYERMWRQSPGDSYVDKSSEKDIMADTNEGF